MKIILSPAKKMNVNTDLMEPSGFPVFMEKAEVLLKWMKSKNLAELQKLWKCSDRIAQQNFERLQRMDLKKDLTPAILSYEGIAYQYMAPAVFEYGHIDYVQEHLRIISAFYGVLKPIDGVTPYRLEMQAKAAVDGCKDLYEFWGRSIYDKVCDDSGVIINLASREYSKCIEKYLKPEDRYITCTFAERTEKSGDRLVTKGTYAKMARGEMVRFMAEHGIKEPEDIRKFDRLGYIYRSDISTDTEYVFERKDLSNLEKNVHISP